jgi:hypothetical protein
MNQGCVDAGESERAFYKVTTLWGGGLSRLLRVKNDYVDTLAQWETSTESFDYNWVCSLPTDKVRVCEDYNDDVTEDDEGNNYKEEKVQYIPSDLPDLVITDIWYNGNKIYYNITNQGTARASRRERQRFIPSFLALGVQGTHACGKRPH